MPKIVDNYVLERKIGTGQFGEVFKGYNKVNNLDIAVKCVKREFLKGKFLELLENEIKVLRSCNNENIIKLYDIKKTANNIYLILEYCNEGDLSVYLKEKKFLVEEEVIEFFLQILNGFKTLVASKIMHRDFKLANILKHNGSIKIADFGFSKLLGSDNWTSTMLGSPLNMAPEVLDGKEYNSKADIWSIGTVLFELLFGKPPYNAGNMIDLLKAIKNKPLEFPRRINKISKECEELIRDMLVVDWKKRIDWENLFEHPITHYYEDQIKNELKETLKGDDMNMNISRLYIKSNKVIAHPSEIERKEEFNNFAYELTKGNVKNDNQNKDLNYQGPINKRKIVRNEEEEKSEYTVEKDSKSNQEGEMVKGETEREIQIRTVKRNANRILHERNIYVFLASVAEDTMNFQTIFLSDFVSFILIKKLFMMIDELKCNLQNFLNIYSLPQWEYFVTTKDFRDICSYISREFEIFKVYFDQLYDKVQFLSQKNNVSDENLISMINKDYNQNIDKQFTKLLIQYVRDIIQDLTKRKPENSEDVKKIWIHVDRILDCLKIDEVFVFEDELRRQFNFKFYYEEVNMIELEALVRRVDQKLKSLNIF